MSRMKRFAVALLLAQPLVVSAGGAFAFSLVDGPSSAGMNISDPEAWSDDLSDQLPRVWSAPNPDYSRQASTPGFRAGQRNSACRTHAIPGPPRPAMN